MKKSFLTAFIVASMFLSATASDRLPVNKEKEVAITSLGVTNGEMAFNLKYENAAEDKLSIVLSDDRGLVLYKEFTETKNVNKTFKTAAEVGTVYVTVTNLRDKSKKKFEITNEKRYVEEVMITSVN